MSASSKSIAVVVLTFFLMGFANYMQHNSFIVPFPFISEFIFVIAITVSVLDYKSFSLVHFSFFFYALFGVFSGRFLWELFLDYEQILHLFEETIFIDLFRIIQFFFMFFLVLLVAVRLLETKKRIAIAFCGIMLPFVLLSNGVNILSLWYVVLALFSFGALRFGDEIQGSIKSVLEGLVGIGLLYLLTLVTQVVV